MQQPHDIQWLGLCMETGPLRMVPAWLAYTVHEHKLVELPRSLQDTMVAKTARILCNKCEASRAPGEWYTGPQDAPPAVEQTQQHVDLERYEICWGEQDGTSRLCGIVWTGKCPHCGTLYMAWRDATPQERAWHKRQSWPET